MKKKAALPFQFLVYLLLRFAETLIGLFPLRVCMRFGSTMGGLACSLSGSYRKLVHNNLTVAYHETKSEDEIAELTRKHFLTLGSNLMASIRTSLMDNRQIEELVSYEGVEGFQKALAAGNGVVGALTHTANWELYARINPLGNEIPFGTIYQKLRNPFIDNHIKRRRSALGTSLFERRSGFRQPSEFLRNGGALGVLMDQYPGARGILAPLFGRLTSTTTLPSLLSLRTGAPVMFVGMHPDGEAKWKIKFHDPIYPPEDKADRNQWSLDLTATLNRKLADTIKDNPEEWFWVHNRFKSSGRNVFPFGRKLQITLPPDVPIDKLTPHYILVRSPDSLGEACMSIPAVRAIKAGRPDAHVTILCNTGLEPLWRRQADVDDIIAQPENTRPAQAGKAIRERRPYYDTAILLSDSIHSALEIRAGGIPMRYGYPGKRPRKLLRWVIPEPPTTRPIHRREHYLHMARMLGADIRDRKTLFALPDPPAPILAGQSEWRICLCPGSESGEASCWPLARYAAAVNQLQAGLPGHAIEVLIIGNPEEGELGEELEAALEVPTRNLIGKSTADELIKQLQSCHFVLCNDCGIMHLAAVLGIPTVAIFGPTEPLLTGPPGDVHRVIREKVDCSPCFKKKCPIDFRCMNRIGVDRVVSEIRNLMLGDEA